MARIRTIKPEFWGDEKLAPLSPITRLVFLGLISMADDKGRLGDNLKRIDAFIFPESSETCRGSLDELSVIGRIRRGVTASGQSIIELSNWHHQKIERPNYLGALGDITQEVTPHSPTNHRSLTDESPTNHRDVAAVSVSVSAISTGIGTSTSRGVRQPRTRSPKPVEAKWPDFPTESRQELHACWQTKVGTVSFPALVHAIAPYWTPTDATTVSRAVRDYCGLIGRGRSAPFASPADLAKKLGGLIENARRNGTDPIARMEGAETVIHGQRSAA